MIKILGNSRGDTFPGELCGFVYWSHLDGWFFVGEENWGWGANDYLMNHLATYLIKNQAAVGSDA